MRIAVDMDDVMLDFMNNVMTCFYREYGISVKWDGDPWGPDAVAFTKHSAFKTSGYKDWWGWLRDRDWLWGIAPAIPGAIGGVKQLRAAGHYLELVTSKPEWAEPQVWRWLGKWRPAFERVTITKPGTPKVTATNADLIIDDKLETCSGFIEAGRYAIHFDRTMYASTTDGERFFVAKDWQDVLDSVNIIEEVRSA